MFNLQQQQQDQKFQPSDHQVMNQQFYNHIQQQQQQLHHQQQQLRLNGVDPNLLLNQYGQDLNDDILSPQPSEFPTDSLASSPYATQFNLSMSVPAPNHSYSSFSSFQSTPKLPEDENGGSLRQYFNINERLDIINEKRRKRRESHNAVERRRRDHINEKIQELSSLLPEFPSDAQNKPNKGVVLSRSVDYIRHMQLFASKQMDRTLELEQCLMRICEKMGVKEEELGLSYQLGSPVNLPQLQDHNNLE